MGFEDMPSLEFGLVVGFMGMTINLWDSLVQKIVSPIEIIANCWRKFVYYGDSWFVMQLDTVINLLVSYLVRLLVGLSVNCYSVSQGW